MIFHPLCKCDRRTIIWKIGSAELHVVFNDGIKTFAGRLSFDRKDETGTKQTAPEEHFYCLHLPTEYRTKMQSRCKNLCRCGAEKIEIMLVRRKNGFCKEYCFGQDKFPWDTSLDQKNHAAKF